jgi:hypothetical protein
MSRPTQQAASLREVDDNIILKFRTITTLLDILQQLPSEEKKPMELRTRDDKQELRVLGALATILVQRFQVAAVTTEGSANDVSLVACAEESSRSETPDQASSLTNSFFAAINPRRPKNPRPERHSGVPPDRITVIQTWTTEITVKKPKKAKEPKEPTEPHISLIAHW